ncbi:hypothetical protein MUK42_36185 [Musa troglodytarum]|uniref:Uncharacterized protein n=1 Tax=Musa troglodytarum TaxID=320322 RepID=A0A9E7HW05_9LILI|nr:hypothetical protein MUK42_36185 [Musa troglodytarum]
MTWPLNVFKLVDPKRSTRFRPSPLQSCSWRRKRSVGWEALASWKRIPLPSHRLGFCGSQSGNVHRHRGATCDIANMEEDTVDSNPK